MAIYNKWCKAHRSENKRKRLWKFTEKANGRDAVKTQLYATVRSHYDSVDRIADDEKARCRRRRYGEQERVACRFRTLEAEAARRRHGNAGTARSRIECQGLGDADDERRHPGHVGHFAAHETKSVGDIHEDAEDDGVHCDKRHTAQVVTEASEFECRADQDDRDGSDQDVEGKPAVGGNPSSERIN